MNRFVTNVDPVIAAQDQCDKHLRKMIIEEAQMLSTALHDNYPQFYREDLYKPVHQRHPCTLWVGESCSNWLWGWHHFRAMAKEYEHRFGSQHLTATKLLGVFNEIRNRLDFVKSWSNVLHTEHPQCFGNWHHKSENEGNFPVLAYQSYIRDYKPTVMRKMEWTRRTPPRWFRKGGNHGDKQ